VLPVLPGGADAGEALVTDPNVPVISFTGSTAADCKVRELAGRPLLPAGVRLHVQGLAAPPACTTLDSTPAGERTSVSLMTLAKVHDQSKSLHCRPAADR
jgi:hypothetical protein